MENNGELEINDRIVLLQNILAGYEHYQRLNKQLNWCEENDYKNVCIFLEPNENRPQQKAFLGDLGLSDLSMDVFRILKSKAKYRLEEYKKHIIQASDFLAKERICDSVLFEEDSL